MGESDGRNVDPQTQLRSTILEMEAPATVASLEALELSVPHDSACCEWRTNVFVDAQSATSLFRDPMASASRFVSGSSRVGTGSSGADGFEEIQRVSANVFSDSLKLIEPRITTLLRAVAKQLPALSSRLMLGADVTIRRTIGEQHALRAPYERHDPSAVHSDSWDGLVLGFGIVSSKLGTPIYPEASFPAPIKMFLSQSKTGRSSAHQHLAKQGVNITCSSQLTPVDFIATPGSNPHPYHICTSTSHNITSHHLHITSHLIPYHDDHFTPSHPHQFITSTSHRHMKSSHQFQNYPHHITSTLHPHFVHIHIHIHIHITSTPHPHHTQALGSGREWSPGTLVVMPAATAHSKPTRQYL